MYYLSIIYHLSSLVPSIYTSIHLTTIHPTIYSIYQDNSEQASSSEVCTEDGTAAWLLSRNSQMFIVIWMDEHFNQEF